MFNSRWKYEKLTSVVHALPNVQNLVISRCFFYRMANNWSEICNTGEQSKLSSIVKIWIVYFKYESCTAVVDIYLTWFHCTGRYELDLAPNVWLHSSVGRASHRYRGGHGFESRWSPDIFQASSFQLGKFTAMITLHFHLLPQYKYELFHIYLTWFHCTGRYELNKLTLLPMCGFIAQLVEHRTGIAEVMGSNPVEALIFFFRLLLSNCLNWKIYCDDHTSLLVYFKYESCEKFFSLFLAVTTISKLNMERSVKLEIELNLKN